MDKLDRLGNACLAVALLSIIATCVSDIALGGDAASGMAQGGRYYLGNKGSHLTQVSRAVYTASLWDERLMLVTFPLGTLLKVPAELRRRAAKRAA